MKIIAAKDYAAMSRAAADLLERLAREEPEALVSVAGGETPAGLVEEFCRRVREGCVDPSGLRFVQLDEWVGIGPKDAGSCAHFIQNQLLGQMAVPFREAFIFDGAREDIDGQLAAQDAFIRRYGPVSMEMLGIGMNGHLGFNEDGVDFSLRSHRTPLSPVTRTVQKKYFGGRDLPLTEGMTQGIAQIMESKTAVVLASGEKKAEIVARAVTGPVTNEVPASVLQRHPNCLYLLDEAAASRLPRELVERI